MMKKLLRSTLLLPLLLLLMGRPADAQVVPGTQLINVGLGLGVNYFGYYHVRAIPAIDLSYEYGMAHVGPGTITLGGEAGTQIYFTQYTNWSVFRFGARAAWHYNWDIGELDTWAGASVGARITGGTVTNPSGEVVSGSGISRVRLSPGLFVGGSYKLTHNLSVFAEIGRGLSWMRAGLQFTIHKSGFH